VLIEASIIEVTLNDDLKYGLQWAFTDKARNGLSGSGVLSNATNTVANIATGLGTTMFGGSPAGFSYTLANSLGDVRAVLNALADKSLVKVISSPSLMVLDNYTASIAVGNQQPIQVGETITVGGNVSNNIQYKDTGVSLTVTPSVNAGNMVSMQLSQAVTDVGPVDTATGQRSFLQRQFASKVAVRSGETLVLGGLIRDNTTNGKTGLPLLQEIPLIGNLFGATATNTNRTELVVLITPRVVRSTQDMREVTQEFKDGLKTLFPTVALPLSQVDTVTQQPSSSKP
jgi:general secretion pathway protein D